MGKPYAKGGPMPKLKNLAQLNLVYGVQMHMSIRKCLSLLKTDIVG